MNVVRRTIFIISADALVTQECIDELAAFDGRYQTFLASSAEKARKSFAKTPPAVVFLDESAIDSRRNGETLDFVAEDFHARVIQHETDHLKGEVYIDRMPDMRTLAHLAEWQRYVLPELNRKESKN